MLPIINIGRARVSRKIAIGKRQVVYEKVLMTLSVKEFQT
jgi:hypothetical protein